MFRTPTQAQSIWHVYFNSFNLYRHVFVKCLPWTIIIAILAVIARKTLPATAVIELHNAKLYIIPSLVNLLSFLVLGCMIYQINRSLLVQNTTVGETLKKGLLGALLGFIGYIVLGIVFFVGAVIVFTILKFIPVGGMVYIGIILFCAAGIYLLIALFTWFPLTVIETNPIKTFIKSFTLIKRNWWRTFGFFLMIVISVLIVNIIIYLLTGTHFAQITDKAPASIDAYVAFVAIPIIVLPWTWSATLLQVHNLQLSKQ